MHHEEHEEGRKKKGRRSEKENAMAKALGLNKLYIRKIEKLFPIPFSLFLFSLSSFPSCPSCSSWCS
jgi:hypothetical protein